MLRYIALLTLSIGIAKSQTCDDGWEEFGTSCFSFLPNYVNWTEGRQICQDERDGADLAIVAEANTLRDIYEYINSYSLSGSFWIGGSDAEFEGDWHWVDSSRVDYGTPYWALNKDVFGWSHEPSGGTEENCLCIREQRFYYFDDVECDDNNHPICMYTP